MAQRVPYNLFMNPQLPSYTPSRFLEGHVIALTGADRGFGRVLAQGLADAGATLVLVGKQGEQLSTLASVIESRGSTAISMQADVSVPLDWVKVQARILEIFGALRGVVHSADKRMHASQLLPNQPEALLSEAEWLELFQANIKSSVAVVQSLQQRLPESWLTIIGPHLDEEDMPAQTQRGALGGLVSSARSEHFRVNLLLPSRAPSGEDDLDTGMVSSVLALAAPTLMHLSGLTVDVLLPELEKHELEQLTLEQRANFLLPRARAAQPKTGQPRGTQGSAHGELP